MTFTPPAFSQYTIQDKPSTATPLDAATFTALQANQAADTRAVASSLAGYVDTETARAKAAEALKQGADSPAIGFMRFDYSVSSTVAEVAKRGYSDVVLNYQGAGGSDATLIAGCRTAGLKTRFWLYKIAVEQTGDTAGNDTFTPYVSGYTGSPSTSYLYSALALNSPLATGSPITTLPLTAPSAGFTNATQLVILSGANTQTFVVNGTVTGGTVGIPINSITPNFAYPTNSLFKVVVANAANMDIGNTAYRTTAWSNAITQALTNGYDGIWEDSAFTRPLADSVWANAGVTTGLPGAGTIASDVAYQTARLSWITYGKGQCAANINSTTGLPLQLFANLSGVYDAPTIAENYMTAGYDGGLDEGFLEAFSSTSTPNPANLTRVNNTLSFGQWCEANGKTLMVHGYVQGSNPANLYALAGALLIGSGHVTYSVDNGYAAYGIGQLTSALASGTPITSIPGVTALTSGIGSGQTFTVTTPDGSTKQTFTTSGTAALGATSIAINSATPTVLFPIGSIVSGGGALAAQYTQATGAWSTIYDIARALGRPLGLYFNSAASGVYVRLFTNGMVLVNPTTGTVVEPVTGISLITHSAAIIPRARNTAVQATSVSSPVTGATYTFALGDAGAVVEGNRATGQTFTIPPYATVQWPTGSVIDVFQDGAGQITIAGGTNVTLRSDAGLVNTKAQYATIRLRCRGTDEWVLSGDLA